MANKTSFSCGEALDIAHVVKLHNRLQQALEKSANVELKADRVQKADSAGLQLLVALEREARLSGGKIMWKAPSDALLAAARQLGLADALQLNAAK